MSTETITSLIGLVLFAGWAGLIASAFLPDLRRQLTDRALPITASVAVCATAGSLYFSEVAEFLPCELCWFQRIAMYPLSVMLVMASFRRDRAIFRYVIVLAALGLAVSAYHVWIQLFPEDSNFCSITDPCTAKWVEAFGFLTIPQMAGLSFGLIIVLSALALRADRHSDPTETDDELVPATSDTERQPENTL